MRAQTGRDIAWNGCFLSELQKMDDLQKLCTAQEGIDSNFQSAIGNYKAAAGKPGVDFFQQGFALMIILNKAERDDLLRRTC